MLIRMPVLYFAGVVQDSLNEAVVDLPIIGQ